MNPRQLSITRFAALTVVPMLSMVLYACSAPLDCFEQGYGRSYSNQGAAVYVTVDSNELVLVNDTPYPIYHESISSELIDIIEWGPCDRPDDCPEIRIEPGETGRIDLRTFGNEAEGPVWVYWWHISEPGTDIDVSYEGVKLILADLPPRVKCEKDAT